VSHSSNGGPPSSPDDEESDVDEVLESVEELPPDEDELFDELPPGPDEEPAVEPEPPLAEAALGAELDSDPELPSGDEFWSDDPPVVAPEHAARGTMMAASAAVSNSVVRLGFKSHLTQVECPARCAHRAHERAGHFKNSRRCICVYGARQTALRDGRLHGTVLPRRQ